MMEVQNTPPHHPIYEVKISRDDVLAIVSYVFPKRQLSKLEQLQSGRSFNNRIYFIDLVPTLDRTDHENDDTSTINRFVLKLSGRNFGARKVQNEVGSLTLLQRYCPSIPVPMLVAWSEDGTAIRTVDGRSCQEYGTLTTPNGWLLMSRRPGRVLTLADLDGLHGNSILEQIAHFVSQWRTLIPAPSPIGHLRFCDLDEPAGNPDWPSPSIGGPRLTVGGLILTHQYESAPLMSSLSFHTYRLQDQYRHLVESSELKSLAAQIAEPVSRLVAVLPKISPFQAASSDVDRIGDVVFSHMDLAPRNVLVSTSEDSQGLTITGLLDFEFSAFLPPEQEFLNSIVHQPDDWSDRQFRILTRHLAGLGVMVPPDGESSVDQGTKGSNTFDETSFRNVYLLEKVTGNIAPWWMTPQWFRTHGEEEARNETEKAATEVLKSMDNMVLPELPI